MAQRIHPTAQQGFSQVAQLYQQVRPDYPQALVDWMRHDLFLDQNAHLVDLGAGTGKFLPYLKQVSHQLSAVEPVSEMLEELKLKYPDVHRVQADSQQMPFATHSIDAIFCAQAFHWFSDHATLEEVHRVLKNGGHFCLIWNQRDLNVDWVMALNNIISPYEGTTPRYHSGDWKKVFEKQNLFRLKSVKVFSFLHQGTVENVVSKRLLSTSFIATLPNDEQLRLKQQFEQIIYEHLGKKPQETIEFPYITYAYHFKRLTL